MQAIDEGEFFDVNGVPQWVALRGAQRANPAVLLIGGPGASFAALAPFFAAWERELTLVHWDPPGAGFTFARSGVETKSIAALAADGVRVGELACARLGKAKLAVLGVSAGTIVGLHMVQRRPEVFSAYVGSGQIVDWPRQDALSYSLLLERARATGNVAMLAELSAIGPPPYTDSATDAVKSKYAGGHAERSGGFRGATAAHRRRSAGKAGEGAVFGAGFALARALRALARRVHGAARRDRVVRCTSARLDVLAAALLHPRHGRRFHRDLGGRALRCGANGPARRAPADTWRRALRVSAARRDARVAH
jgi:pimeloyl-ACP methyl ester carboxylesterase